MYMTNFFVTIGRESGSGGLAIGQMLAEKLGVKCYDKEILSEAAKSSGFAEHVMHEYDETSRRNTLITWAGASGAFTYGMPLATQIYLAQFKAIREIAEKEKRCVFVGRCSDYVLSGVSDNVFSVFIYAPSQVRIDAVCKRTGMSSDKAKEFIKKTDKDRASYYDYYTDKKWGRREFYDLLIDSSKLPYEASVNLIADYVRLRMNNNSEA